MNNSFQNTVDSSGTNELQIDLQLQQELVFGGQIFPEQYHQNQAYFMDNNEGLQQVFEQHIMSEEQPQMQEDQKTIWEIIQLYLENEDAQKIYKALDSSSCQLVKKKIFQKRTKIQLLEESQILTLRKNVLQQDIKIDQSYVCYQSNSMKELCFKAFRSGYQESDYVLLYLMMIEAPKQLGFIQNAAKTIVKGIINEKKNGVFETIFQLYKQYEFLYTLATQKVIQKFSQEDLKNKLLLAVDQLYFVVLPTDKVFGFNTQGSIAVNMYMMLHELYKTHKIQKITKNNIQEWKQSITVLTVVIIFHELAHHMVRCNKQFQFEYDSSFQFQYELDSNQNEKRSLKYVLEDVKLFQQELNIISQSLANNKLLLQSLANLAITHPQILQIVSKVYNQDQLSQMKKISQIKLFEIMMAEIKEKVIDKFKNQKILNQYSFQRVLEKINKRELKQFDLLLEDIAYHLLGVKQIKQIFPQELDQFKKKFYLKFVIYSQVSKFFIRIANTRHQKFKKYSSQYVNKKGQFNMKKTQYISERIKRITVENTVKKIMKKLQGEFQENVIDQVISKINKISNIVFQKYCFKIDKKNSQISQSIMIMQQLLTIIDVFEIIELFKNNPEYMILLANVPSQFLSDRLQLGFILEERLFPYLRQKHQFVYKEDLKDLLKIMKGQNFKNNKIGYSDGTKTKGLNASRYFQPRKQQYGLSLGPGSGCLHYLLRYKK